MPGRPVSGGQVTVEEVPMRQGVGVSGQEGGEGAAYEGFPGGRDHLDIPEPRGVIRVRAVRGFEGVRSSDLARGIVSRRELLLLLILLPPLSSSSSSSPSSPPGLWKLLGVPRSARGTRTPLEHIKTTRETSDNIGELRSNAATHAYATPRVATSKHNG